MNNLAKVKDNLKILGDGFNQYADLRRVKHEQIKNNIPAAVSSMIHSTLEKSTYKVNLTTKLISNLFFKLKSKSFPNL